jgi:hypothetical protein
MHLTEIESLLNQKFANYFQVVSEDSYKIETDEYRLLIILSEQLSWLRILIPIAPAADVMPFISEFLAANFESTLENRYAFEREVLWGVFQHRVESLTSQDLLTAIDRLIAMKATGVNSAFYQFITKRVKEIITIAKQRGDSLEQTIQTLDRFYTEGVMGDVGSTSEVREEMMSAWRLQLTRLWDEVNVN